MPVAVACFTVTSAMKMVAGTASAYGISVYGRSTISSLISIKQSSLKKNGTLLSHQKITYESCKKKEKLDSKVEKGKVYSFRTSRWL